MASRLIEIAVDCRDPQRLAAFWCEALDYRVVDEEEGSVEIGSWAPSIDDFAVEPRPPTIIFVKVPERKTAKNRLHLDISPLGDQREEVERLVELGAHRVDVGQLDDHWDAGGWGSAAAGPDSWVVLADPEGNEFCVLRSIRQ